MALMEMATIVADGGRVLGLSHYPRTSGRSTVRSVSKA